MMRNSLYIAAAAAPFMLAQAAADDNTSALDHAPIGVMGDHLHKKGEWMLSYRAMQMQMEENRIGETRVRPDEIVSSVQNVNAPPPTLRVVPTEMSMTMHMVGAMYAPTDRVTLMVMANYITSEMDHLTFRGMAGTNELGTFTTEVSGFGDTSVSALVGLYKKEHLSIHAGAGFSLPTGSITKTDSILTPMNTRPAPRLPYPMQLGSGTYDFLPSLTLTNKTHDSRFGGGIQYAGTIRLGENDEDYTLGDRHQISAWGAYSPDPRVSFSLRGTAWTRDSIDGADTVIVAPVQTANPDFHGGDVVEVGFGVNGLATQGPLEGHRLAFEFVVPLMRDLNGPQLETDWTATLGWQKAF
ncbi:MAG: transporter [Pseudomonadota bacterium]